jgi:hypothetical protein
MNRMKAGIAILAFLALAGSAAALDFKVADRLVQVHGFLSQGYLNSDRNNYLADTENGTFRFNEYGVNAAVYLLDDLRVGAQGVGRKLGDLGNDKPSLDWAYADYRWRDWLGVRAGRLKLVHGLYNEVRDMDMFRTAVFLPESVYNESWRDSMTAVNGGSLYGSLISDTIGTLSYQAMYGDTEIADDQGLGRYIRSVTGMGIEGIDVTDVFACGLQWQSPLRGMRVGWTLLRTELECDASVQPTPRGQALGLPPGMPLAYGVKVNGNTYSLEYTWRQLVLAAEYMRFDLKQSLALTMPQPLTLMRSSEYIEGYYAGASYRWTDWLETGAVYSEYYPDATDKEGRRIAASTGYPVHTAWLKDWGLTARFDLGENWILKLEGHAMNGSAVMFLDENPGGTSENWILFASKLTYSF